MDRPASVVMHFDGIYGYQRRKQTCVKCAVGKKKKVSFVMVVCVQVMLRLLQEETWLWFTWNCFLSVLNGFNGSQGATILIDLQVQDLFILEWSAYLNFG